MNLSSTEIKKLKIENQARKKMILVRNAKIAAGAAITGLVLYTTRSNIVDMAMTLSKSTDSYMYKKFVDLAELSSMAMPALILGAGSLFNKKDRIEYQETKDIIENQELKIK